MPHAILQNPSLKYQLFKIHVGSVTKKFTKRRSSLRGLCEHMENQIDAYRRQNKAITPFLNTQDAKSYCKNSNDPRLMKYEDCLRRLVESWGKAKNYNSLSSAASVVRRARSELDYCKNYACADAVTFQSSINPKADRQAILDRGQHGSATGLPPTQGFTNGTVSGLSSNAWDVDHLKRIHKQVYSSRSGECTNFGYSAAYVLHKNMCNENARIEVVCWRTSSPKQDWRLIVKRDKVTNQVIEKRRELLFLPSGEPKMLKPQIVTHVFVLVNRVGDTEIVDVAGKKMRKLPDVSTWGRDCLIVDTWLASLGYDSVYEPHLYPKRGMLSPLYQEMDSLVQA